MAIHLKAYLDSDILIVILQYILWGLQKQKYLQQNKMD